MVISIFFQAEQKYGNEQCNESFECISGECTNNKCAKASTMEMIDTSKSQFFGDDTDTNNFLALTIMIVVAGAILILI